VSIAGQLAYQLLHRPLGYVRTVAEAGGPLEVWRTERGRAAMEATAQLLSVPAPATGAPVELHFLTGRRYWYQTAFCLWSFARHAARPLTPVIYDDGSLTEEFRAPLRRLFPHSRFLTETDITARLDAALPAARFPTLRTRRVGFPLLRKITDLHAGLTGWKLFLDSDLLFFREPRFLLDWHDAPSNPLRGEDIENAYGYPLALLDELAGQRVSERVNTGTLGLRSEDIDWDRLESWCRELQARAGTHYYQEQALVALHLAGRDCAVPPPVDHVLFPRPPESVECRAVMHHYVAGSKSAYFRHCWRIAQTR
jgi:hypothetical protein